MNIKILGFKASQKEEGPIGTCGHCGRDLRYAYKVELDGNFMSMGRDCLAKLRGFRPKESKALTAYAAQLDFELSAFDIGPLPKNSPSWGNVTALYDMVKSYL